jgi:hypothetical protein
MGQSSHEDVEVLGSLSLDHVGSAPLVCACGSTTPIVAAGFRAPKHVPNSAVLDRTRLNQLGVGSPLKSFCAGTRWEAGTVAVPTSLGEI